MKIQVSVTDTDIKAAEFHEGEYNQCPVAQALTRLGYTEIDTDEDRILVSTQDVPSQRLFASTPRAAELFIADFDNSQPVAPISFELEFRPATPDDERKRGSGLPQELLDDVVTDSDWDDEELDPHLEIGGEGSDDDEDDLVTGE